MLALRQSTICPSNQISPSRSAIDMAFTPHKALKCKKVQLKTSNSNLSGFQKPLCRQIPLEPFHAAPTSWNILSNESL
jgi:hypothetical protein